MEFGTEKCALLIMKSRKGESVEGTKLPNQEWIKILGEKENYKYLGILKVDQAEIKEKK